jgi:hypothetical protein
VLWVDRDVPPDSRMMFDPDFSDLIIQPGNA